MQPFSSFFISVAQKFTNKKLIRFFHTLMLSGSSQYLGNDLSSFSFVSSPKHQLEKGWGLWPTGMGD